jgi:GNAT superfamily N-acetyltransferase
MSGSPTKAESYDYGKYGLLRFLTPGFNDRKIDEFYKWYSGTVRAYPEVDLSRYDRRPCLAAHSFGTWITCNAMLKYDDMRFDKLILCGSILPRDFNWARLFARDQVAMVRNECGHKDPWPGWASRVAPGMGRSGSTGFDWFETLVEEQDYDEYGHGEFLCRRHIEQHWVPFFRRHPSPLAVRHGRSIQQRQEFSRIFDDTNTLDAEAFGMKYQAVWVPDDLALDWIKVNPDIYTFLLDRESGKTVGYLNAMPVDDSLYAGVRSGRVADNQVPPSGIVAYGRDQEIKIYLMSIAVAEQYRQWGQGLWNQGYVQLIGGFLDKLSDYAKHRSIRATHLLATAWTDQGLRMCKSLGMDQVGSDKFGDAVYELDLAKVPIGKKGMLPALGRLLSVYHNLER